MRALRGFLFISLLLASGAVTFASPPSTELEVGVTENLDRRVRGEFYRFDDEFGRSVPLSTFFLSGRPVILTLVYFECPMVCNALLSGFVEGMQKAHLYPGKDFELITISINPEEKSPLARAKKESYLKLLNPPPELAKNAEAGWHFMTGDEGAIRSLADTVGYRFKVVGYGYSGDKKSRQIDHPAVLIALSPDGHVSNYLYGISFRPEDLQLGLKKARDFEQGSVGRKLLIRCQDFVRDWSTDPGSWGVILLTLAAVLVGVVWVVRIRR